ncbi:MAG: hypothetical protein IT223_03890 [Crocinitomicaceae bacterium]|nr:hypothetical protein [Crocinitomicaceae bacterium]
MNKKRLCLITLIICINAIVSAQGVAIHPGATPPDNSAAMDIDIPGKGTLLSRAALTSVSLASPIVNPAAGLIVYNTTPANGNVCPGYYYWNGESPGQWIRMDNQPCSSPTVTCQTGWNITAGPTTGNLGCVTFLYRNNPVTYTTVRAADGREWLRQNLGAERVASSSTDYLAYGDLFQWGRWDDGHQVIERLGPSSTSLGNNSSASVSTGGAPKRPNDVSPGPDANFYYNGSISYFWWGNGISSDLYNGTTTADVTAGRGIDPCKQLLGGSWHLPTGGMGGEWATWWAAEGLTTGAGARLAAFNSTLRLPASGWRRPWEGALSNVGDEGVYRSATAHPSVGNHAMHLYFSNSGGWPEDNFYRACGASVRCLRN